MKLEKSKVEPFECDASHRGNKLLWKSLWIDEYYV